MRKISAAVVLVCSLVFTAVAAEIREMPELGRHFEAENVSGTFVLFDVEKDTMTVFNRPRAEERFVPASTFKIVNSLIGLKVGAVRDVDEVLPYGGKPQPIAAWEKDMSLRDGIRISNVPVFQELARRIGLVRMAENVKALRYGNQEIGKVVDRFWLDGPLKISAIEQADFLARLADGKLPVEAKDLAAVEAITLQEQRDGEPAQLHAKTGWQPPIGWWVGWFRREDRLFTFALNMDILKEADAPKRLTVGRACLRAFEK